jgi:hypothetical protein
MPAVLLMVIKGYKDKNGTATFYDTAFCAGY